MSSIYRLPDPETIQRHGEQCGTAGEFVRGSVSGAIRTLEEIYKNAAAAGQTYNTRVSALDADTEKAVEQHSYAQREVKAARETQTALANLILKLESAIKKLRRRVADIQEQLSSGGEAADQAALLKEQRALLADMQKKEAELQQEKMKQAELIITVIELDRECMKALVRRNYLLGRKMPLARAYKSFLEQLGPVKKAWEDGTVESLRQKSVFTAEELEHTQTVLRSLAEQLRQNEG